MPGSGTLGDAHVYKIKPDPNNGIDVPQAVPGSNAAEREIAFDRPIRPNEIVEHQLWRQNPATGAYELVQVTPRP